MVSKNHFKQINLRCGLLFTHTVGLIFKIEIGRNHESTTNINWWGLAKQHISAPQSAHGQRWLCHLENLGLVQSEFLRLSAWVEGIDQLSMKSLLLPLALSMITCFAETSDQPDYTSSPQFREGRFHNTVPTPDGGIRKKLNVAWNFFNKPAGTVPDEAIATQTLTNAQLQAAPDGSLYRIGHSTVLLKLRGNFWLTDPVFSGRASGVQWFGPARFNAPPISIADLPPIAGVILSHNHYDHLDRDSILQLASKTSFFFAPLGVGDQLIEWGVERSKVRQLDWWQSVQVFGLELVATPSQHFSGRGIGDVDKTLWASWVMLDGPLRVFFSGDTGYFEGFKAIGEKYGPFDITLMENGAYDSNWEHVHMRPEQTLQAHLDLRGKWLLPIHNGTFDLGRHPWQEPLERISRLSAERQVRLSTPRIGERVDIASPHTGDAWWRGRH